MTRDWRAEKQVKFILGILLIFLLIGSLGLSCIESVTSENMDIRDSTLQISLVQSVQTKCDSSAIESPRIVTHKISTSELMELKSTIGVSVGEEDCNQLIDGHGTGLRPPTEEEWQKIGEDGLIVDKIQPDSALAPPASIDLSLKLWFPPIGNQGSEGSCVAWAVGYYTKTFQEAKEHGWDLSGATWEGGFNGFITPSYRDKIISPDFLYHLINHGVDGGSSYSNAIGVVCSVGAASWEKMPYDPDDHITWPSEEAWVEAPNYRGNSSGIQYLDFDTEEGLTNLKNWVASENLAIIRVDANQYSNLTSSDFWTLDNYLSPILNHANTIVGYDDSVAYLEEGELRYGAFKIANSWGVGGSWENVDDGFYWISYEAMKQTVQQCMFYYDLINYTPKIAATFRMDHDLRNECTIEVGLGSIDEPITSKYFDNYIDGGSHPFCANNILFDITEFEEYIIDPDEQSYYLRVSDWGTSTTGTISHFAVEFAKSTNTPLPTINEEAVNLTVTLSALDTSWNNEMLVNFDSDNLDSKISTANDNKGNMYVAYTDFYEPANKTAVAVRKSNDGGETWPIQVWGYDPSHNLKWASIAVDTYTDDIHVVVEREWTSTDHDILSLNYVNDSWSWSPVASIAETDDRFPSITSEYQYETENKQYISFERLYGFNDRDLMFAKSEDHGLTWTVNKLHGDFFDYNVHAQTSITNAEGNLYIAYKWGADYDSSCEIRIEKSSDFGVSWTQIMDIDGLSGDCQFPSVAATSNESTVVVGFQYDSSETNTDIRYSFSTDNGSTWTKGLELFTSAFENEKVPLIAADENDFFHMICRVGRYIEYRTAHHSQLISWSNPEIISDRWIDKGLAIGYYLNNSECYPCAILADLRTGHIYSYSSRYSSTFRPIHNIDTGLNYTSIQSAIDAPETFSGHTIFVDSGIYYETINVNKQVSIVGEDPTDTIIDGGGGETIISLTTDSIRLQNFTVRNSGSWAAVLLDNVSNCRIENNNLVENANGIGFYGGTFDHPNFNNTISGNLFANNSDSAIICIGSCDANNTVAYNTIVQNGKGINWAGFEGSHSHNNTIIGNEISNNTGTAILFRGYHASAFANSVIENNITNNDVGISSSLSGANSTIQENNISYNRVGIYLQLTSFNTISYNKIVGNTDFGIWLSGTSNTKISANNISENANGTRFDLGYFVGPPVEASNNSILENDFVGNYGFAVQFENSSDSQVFHNNFIDNAATVYTENSTNTWNDEYPSGGNYWSDYAGNDNFGGQFQNQTGSDGIGDTPYILDGSNQDNFPLMVPWTLSFPENNYLVVRGSNDYVYFRTFNSTDDSWGNWIALPGSTVDTPAAQVLEDELHIVVRGMDEHTLWHGTYNLTSESFFGWTMLAGSSPSPPVLTSNGTTLCLVVHGMDDLIYYRCYSEDVWGDWQLLPNGATIDSPAAALLGDELHVVVRGMDGFTMWHKIIIPEGGVVQEWTWIPGASASPPILAASQNRNELYMLVRGADDGIYYCEYTSSWGGWTNLQGLTPTSPCATICGDELHVVVCGSDEITLWHGVVDLETDVFGGWSWISGTTPSAPTLTS